MTKIVKEISNDALGCLEYREKVYGIHYTLPTSNLRRALIIFSLFKKNINGFRDLVYFRLKGTLLKRFLIRIFKPTANLVLDVDEISSGGCFFHHPFSTYINAQHIGSHCSFRNNTTIGNKVIDGINYRPVLEDNVFVGPNVVIIGNVKIGRNSIIGAGSVVTKDVPPFAVVGGNPARLIKYVK